MISLPAIVLLAQVAAPLPDGAQRSANERLSDGVGLVLSAYAGGLAGGALGFAVCDDDADFGWVKELLLASLLAGAGFFAGAALFHTQGDSDGSMNAAVVGALAGIFVGGSIASEIESTLGGVTVVLLTTSLGMGLGYGLFDNDSITPTINALPDGRGGVSAGLGLTGSF